MRFLLDAGQRISIPLFTDDYPPSRPQAVTSYPIITQRLTRRIHLALQNNCPGLTPVKVDPRHIFNNTLKDKDHGR